MEPGGGSAKTDVRIRTLNIGSLANVQVKTGPEKAVERTSRITLEMGIRAGERSKLGSVIEIEFVALLKGGEKSMIWRIHIFWGSRNTKSFDSEAAAQGQVCDGEQAERVGAAGDTCSGGLPLRRVLAFQGAARGHASRLGLCGKRTWWAAGLALLPLSLVT